MKPMWECKHDWWIEDFKFDLEQIWELKLLLRKHPDPEDKIGECLRIMINNLKKHLDRSVKDYVKIYGGKPNLKKLREEIEVEK